MTTKAFVGKVFLEVGDGASPEVYTRYCEMTTLGGLGQQNALIEATTFCSGGNKEYIPGLADGKEVTIDANYDPDNTVQNRLIADVKAKTTRHMHIIVEDDSPHTVFAFAAAMLGWELVPSVSAQNKIAFVFKISGDITIAN